jgi:structure-specific recognition protein 1
MAKKVAKATKQTKPKAPKKETTGTKKRKEKKVKDPNAPKRGLAPYIIFTQARRASLTKENPSLNHKEIISAMSKEWNALSESDKAPYVKKAEIDKARYKREMEAYNKKK